MGLDNGIRLKNLESTKKDIDFFPSFLDGNEICYWRKCYGIRGDIISVLRKHREYDDNEYEYRVPMSAIDDIIHVILKYMDKKYYEENHQSIWEYEDRIESFGIQIAALSWAKSLIKQYPDVEMYFYDSY